MNLQKTQIEFIAEIKKKTRHSQYEAFKNEFIFLLLEIGYPFAFSENECKLQAKNKKYFMSPKILKNTKLARTKLKSITHSSLKKNLLTIHQNKKHNMLTIKNFYFTKYRVKNLNFIDKRKIKKYKKLKINNIYFTKYRVKILNF